MDDVNPMGGGDTGAAPEPGPLEGPDAGGALAPAAAAESVADKIARVAEMSDDELSSFEDEVLSQFESIQDAEPTAESVTQMTELADALDAIRIERNGRSTEAPAAEAAPPALEGEENLPGPGALAASTEEEPAQTFSDETVAEAAPEAATETAPETVPEVLTETAVVETVVEPEAPVTTLQVETPAATAPEPATELSAESAETTIDPSTEEVASVAVPEEAEAAVQEPSEVPATQEANVPDSTIEGAQNEAVTATAAVVTEQPPATFSAPANRRPRESLMAQLSITAGGDIPGVSAGSPLEDMRAVAKAFMQRMHSMRRTTGGDGEQMVVATFHSQYPEDRILYGNEFDSNAEKIKKVTSTQAITAGGGYCAPVEVRYDVYGIGGTQRPVRDSLASFTADRGGIQFQSPPALYNNQFAASGDVDNYDADPTPGAPPQGGTVPGTHNVDRPVTIWDGGTGSANGSGSLGHSKNVLIVKCGGIEQAYLDAISVILQFDNMMARAHPELVTRHNELSMIAQARLAEQNLLNGVKAGSKQIVLDGSLVPYDVGAGRAVLNAVDQLAPKVRYRHRIADTDSLRAIFPSWLKNQIRTDLTSQAPGDGLAATFDLADAAINGFFAARNINVTWADDDIGVASDWGWPDSADWDPAAPPAIPTPATGQVTLPGLVEYALFPEGTWLFLDGGTLDLGLVRDSHLNATNDYQTFVETFEAVAKVGIESLWVTQPLCPNGEFGGPLVSRDCAAPALPTP